MAKPEAKEAEGTSEPFNYKTWVLRVSIHCEGCKRKVKKILQNINGVYAVEIDRKQQKVTVTTNTDAETLIKKLVKAGKHAELWPEKKPNSNNIKPKPTPLEISGGETTAAHDGGMKKHSAETEAPLKEVQDPSKTEEKGGSSGNAEVPEMSKAGERRGGVADNDGGGGDSERVVEPPPEVKQTSTLRNAAPSSEGGGEKSIAAETQPGGPSGAVAVEASGGGGRKKKKKAQKKEKSGGGGEGGAGDGASLQTVPAPACTGSATPRDHHDQIPAAHHSSPRNQAYYYPVHTVVSQPAYVASYNTAYPSSSYGLYYAAPPPYSYAYAHSTIPRDISPPSSPLPLAEQSNSPPSNPFDFFSDENPSGCSVM